MLTKVFLVFYNIMLSKCQKRQEIDKSRQKSTKWEKEGTSILTLSIAQHSVSITFA